MAWQRIGPGETVDQVADSMLDRAIGDMRDQAAQQLRQWGATGQAFINAMAKVEGALTQLRAAQRPGIIEQVKRENGQSTTH